MKNHNNYEPVKANHPDLALLFALALGNPTLKKIQKTLFSYGQPDTVLFGCISKGKVLGMLGSETIADKAIIKHLAVLESHHRQGIGKNLVTDFCKRFRINNIEAETDGDAVKFYTKIGFVCVEFEGLYGKRYRCHKNFETF
jgi:ribosomal protein S18 acetylase RimI-like enzyme